MTIFDRPVRPFTHKIRRARVAQVIRGDLFTRILLMGPDLAEIQADGPEDHAKLVLPADDGGAPEFRHDPVSDRWRPQAPSRDMTLRFFDAQGCLAIDVAMHDDGPLVDWARRVEPGGWGCGVALMGPRASQGLPNSRNLILGADGSALPALNRWLELADDEVTIDVVVDEAHMPGAARCVSTERVRSLHVIDSSVDGEYVRKLSELTPSQEHYVWLAGEASTLIAPRKWLRSDDVAVVHENIKVQGYWKMGVAGRDHHEPLDPGEGN